MIHKVATRRRRRNSCKGGELERDRETKSTPLLLPPNAYFHMREIQLQINTTPSHFILIKSYSYALCTHQEVGIMNEN